MSVKIWTILLAVLAVSCAQESQSQNKVKRSYVCPPNFIRLSHRCYFFSKLKVTWQEAYYQCQAMHSNLAIIKNGNQDRLIRKTLSRKTLEPLERWLGGRYDWQQKQWKWAASGKPLSYKGFDKTLTQKEDGLTWNCIVIDPELQYRWNTRSCLEQKHFICHKKIQTVTNNKSRKKLLQQYKVNKLNEIPVPDLPTNTLSNPNELKSHQLSPANLFKVEINTDLDPQFAYRKKPKVNKKRRKNKFEPLLKQFPNGTIYENNVTYLPTVLTYDKFNRRRRNKAKEDESGINPMERIQWRTYKENNRKHPLHPKPIVEEYNLVKDI